jgi:hypothetical protein
MNHSIKNPYHPITHAEGWIGILYAGESKKLAYRNTNKLDQDGSVPGSLGSG